MRKQNADIPEGYKMTELGPLPEDWEVVSVTDVAEFSKKPRTLNIDGDTFVPFIPMELIPDDGSAVKTWESRRYRDMSSGSFVFKGDLVVAKITPSFENGKQALLDNLPTDYAYATTEVWALHPKDADKLYLPHLYNYLRNPFVRGALAGAMEGSTGRQRVPKHIVAHLTITLPPLAEQKEIAAVLSAVQEAKEKTEGVIASLRELKKSLMKHLFTYGSVPVDDADAVVLKDTQLGRLPEEWDVALLEDVIEEDEGLKRGPWGGSVKKEIFVPQGYKVYEQGNVIASDFSKGTYYIDSTKFSELIDFRVRPGDILLTAAGTIGKLAVVPPSAEEGIINQALIRIRVDEKAILKDYFMYMFNNLVENRALEQISHGATLKNLASVRTLRSLPLPLPPLPVQTRIVDTLAEVDKKMDAEEDRRLILNKLFRTLLHDLMTAKIRVNEVEVAV